MREIQEEMIMNHRGRDQMRAEVGEDLHCGGGGNLVEQVGTR